LICRSLRAAALQERRVRRVPQQQALQARLHLLQVPQVPQVPQQVRGRKPLKHPQRHSRPLQAQLRQAQPI